jgi:hypothetical protein
MSTGATTANSNCVHAQHQNAVRDAIACFSRAISTNDAKDVAKATEALIRAIAESPKLPAVEDARTISSLTTLDPSLLASSYAGRAQFFTVLKSRTDDLHAMLDAGKKDRPIDAGVSASASDELSAISSILHHVATFDALPSNRLVRFTALKMLNHEAATPLLSSLHVLAAAQDPEVKTRAIAYLMRHMSFPLSAGIMEELQAAHQIGGKLLGVLCRGVDTTRGRPAWMTAFPGLVKQWQLACSGARVESGVSEADLAACTLAQKGPLNEWHVRYALSPKDPLSLAFFQSGLRRLIGC